MPRKQTRKQRQPRKQTRKQLRRKQTRKQNGGLVCTESLTQKNKHCTLSEADINILSKPYGPYSRNAILNLFTKRGAEYFPKINYISEMLYKKRSTLFGLRKPQSDKDHILSVFKEINNHLKKENMEDLYTENPRSV